MADSTIETAPTTRIAIAGNPNSGKTTLFNALTGLRQKVANYPGVTVEKREGEISGLNITLLDLPGTYSLSARSPDEQIARDVIQGRLEGVPRPDGILIVVDASNLERNLYLATQILDFGWPVVIACNMSDMAEQNGLQIDYARLEMELGVPVVPIVASTGVGLERLRQVLTKLTKHSERSRPWPLEPVFEEAVAKVATCVEQCGALPAHATRAGALLWLMDFLSGEASARASAERFLAKLPTGCSSVILATATTLARQYADAPASAIEARYRWISELSRRAVVHERDAGRVSRSDRLDRLLTHKVFGLVIFAGVMFGLFVSIFWWAEPLMSLIETGQNRINDGIKVIMPDGPLQSLLTDGLITGVGAVVSFFPQICILFFCLALMEDTGYMARAAFLMDRLMSRVGLHGKSFIPLLSSYACAIPGILATRTIENTRDRFTTIMIAPLMSCSARLPVYLIVIGAVFGDRTIVKAGMMFSLYALGTITALIMALIFKRTLFAGPRPPFIMELPPYRLPKVRSLILTMWDRSKLFLTNAGTTIVAVCVIIWALSYFPRLRIDDLDTQKQAKLTTLDSLGDHRQHDVLFASEQLRQSYMGRLGQAIEPVMRPIGLDWRMGVGILSSFLAREVFVGAMGITFAVGEPEEHADALRDQLSLATWPDGRRVLTTAAACSLLVFYVFACQCVSTLAVVRKETGSWRWPAFMFAYMTVLAYAAALLVYQVGNRVMGG